MKRSGRVEIRQQQTCYVQSPRYNAHWERRAKYVEATFDELEEAIEWGRARAPRVHVNLRELPGAYVRYSLGDPRSSEKPWPRPLPPEPRRASGFGGQAYISDQAFWVPEGFVAVHWDGSSEVETTHHGYDLERAIDWGRARADIVIVEAPPNSFSVPPAPKAIRYSAGNEDPPGEDLPRLRPPSGEKTIGWQATFGDGTQYTVDAGSLAEAEERAMEQYVREVLQPKEGETFTAFAPEVRPISEPVR
jgi:hypothetical protein